MTAPKRSLKVRILSFLAVSLLIVGTVGGLVGYLWFSRHLPSVAEMKENHFPVVTEVYDDKGEVIGELYDERRYQLDYALIPRGMIDAILSAEDSDFFTHGGVDPWGILRAALKNAREGEVKQGGSTISMQLAKSFINEPMGRWTKKIKQIILAERIEGHFSKPEILALYLNNVFFGRNAYGVEAAAREYFNKHVDQLDAAQYALLAGLPKEPSLFSLPEKFPRWKERQEWILDREAKLGKITPAEAEAAKKEPVLIQPHHDGNLDTAPYFVEWVRQYLEKAYGDDALLKEGLKVYTTADARMSRAATIALQDGLRDIDKRQGWRGAAKTVDDKKDWLATLGELDARRGLAKGKPLGLNERIEALVTAVDNKEGKATLAWGPDSEGEKATEKGTLLLRDAVWARPPDPKTFWADAPVTALSKVMKPGDLVWMEKKVLSSEEKKEKDKPYQDGELYVTLEQEPAVQGAMVAMDPQTGAIRVMVGGYDFTQNKFNRVVQARRQPGSAFKAVIYSAAVDKGYTPSTILEDKPLIFADAIPDPSVKDMKADEGGDTPEDTVWKPKNYGERYEGDVTFRTALVKSKNVPTVGIVTDIGFDYVAEYAKNLGYPKDPNRDLSIALGSLDVSPLELASIYSVFPSGGRKVDSYFIEKVVAKDGTVLEFHAPAGPADFAPVDLQGALGLAVAKPVVTQTHYALTYPEGQGPKSIDQEKDDILRGKKIDPAALAEHPDLVMDPKTVYVMIDLMKQVVLFGTGAGANLGPGRPVAGKTGTTNDEGDAWFMGYTPDLVAGVWVGFDDVKKPLGKSESGGHTAVPIWRDFMVEAIKEIPARDFPQPPGIVRLQVDRDTGLRACPDTPNPVWVSFKEGTEPADYVCRPGASGNMGTSTTNSTGLGNTPTGLPPE